MINFIAIDFETANESRDSACAIGTALVSDGQIVDRRYTLLNPKVTFETFCTYIHGINEAAVKNAPTFEDIYPMIYKMLNGQVVAAHNAPFDIGVLRASCESRKLAMPNLISFDSVEMARKAWPDLPHHRLNSLAAHFSLPLKHHNAVEDATACALLILRAADELRVSSIEDLKVALEQKSAKDARARKKSQLMREKLIKRAKQELAMESLENALLHK